MKFINKIKKKLIKKIRIYKSMLNGNNFLKINKTILNKLKLLNLPKIT